MHNQRVSVPVAAAAHSKEKRRRTNEEELSSTNRKLAIDPLCRSNPLTAPLTGQKLFGSHSLIITALDFLFLFGEKKMRGRRSNCGVVESRKSKVMFLSCLCVFTLETIRY